MNYEQFLQILIDEAEQLFKIQNEGPIQDHLVIERRFYLLRTRMDTMLSKLLCSDHHALADLRLQLTVPNADILARMLGILDACKKDLLLGVLHEPARFPGGWTLSPDAFRP